MCTSETYFLAKTKSHLSNNKIMNKNTVTQTKTVQLSEIGIYNLSVTEGLKTSPLTAVEQITIKNFNDFAQRKKLKNTQYNEQIAAKNETYQRPIFLKRGKENAPNPYYAYINYPFINPECIRIAMTNFRKHMYIYNDSVKEYNLGVKAYNSECVKTVFELTASEKEAYKTFTEEHKGLLTKDYNELAKEYNKTNNIIALKKTREIKPQYETTFYHLLGFYASQLKQRNGRLMEYGKPTSVAKNQLPKVRINHNDLVTFCVDDVRRVNLTKRSVQNHTQVFVESGLLENYQFFNRKTPVFANFNPKILTILDGKLPKSQTPVNSTDSIEKVQPLHKLKYSTRTLFKEKRKNEDYAKSIAGVKCGSSQESKPKNYKNTSSADTKEKLGRAEIKNILPDFLKSPEKGFTKPNKFTLNFINRLLDDKVLAENLANGDYDNYQGLRYDYLLKIQLYAVMDPELFKKVLLQDFIKSSAKIWKNHRNTPYTGEWKKAINTLNAKLFKGITDREVIINKLREYRWKLEFARKWFIKNEVKALYPSDYFDENRTKQHEIGFFGLQKIYKKHLEYKKQDAVTKKEKTAASAQRKRDFSNKAKLERAVSKYVRGVYTFGKLHDYVSKNLPNEYTDKLFSLINTGIA